MAMEAIKNRLRRSSTDPVFSTDGAIGMKILSDTSNANIDIVFVHGLTSNREETWTHKKGIFWPQDLLARDFPIARIMTFGFDVDLSRIWKIAASSLISDHGQALAYALVSEREDCSTRPILFIAHGFGGLVCQKALILSTRVDGLWQISSYALGIIFMGTPHHGESLARHTFRLAKYIRTTKKGHLGMISGPNDLQRDVDTFQDMLHGGAISLKVFCFYETKPMNETVGKIVDESSAVLRDFKGCRIDANHFNMTKFSGRWDAGYKRVQTLVSSLIGTSQEKGEAALSETSNYTSVASSTDASCPRAPLPTN
ncbi:hypothetical protein N7508_004039 [Penicillium antarcticum]|uniref:uncharacterized protein n=1 Tax=Penicillium antarcticum TaxID=416450 RepID=UPI00239F44A1|nr:uncharacterized protein N7508_004039 [Penicillium antarcticum]KAJ5308660.1 hypothetical protein N7508_004039 [Penicillium antarcticum]